LHQFLVDARMLSSREIRELAERGELIEGYVDLDMQIQPCGFDLSLGSVEAFLEPGSVDFTNMERRLPPTFALEPDSEGWFNLSMGSYLVVYNEVVKLPLNIAAMARPRSTLLRCGATLETALWDPGYRGRSSSLLVVHNPRGIRLKRGARIAQLIFFRVEGAGEGYRGIYQMERLER
jgi:dUTP pyrophosphatase